VKTPRARIVAGSIALLASALWLGGLTVLGAIVAPTIFHNVPAPTSADAMTLVFQRFDRVTMACGAVALVLEGWRAIARERDRTRADVARIIVTVSAAAAAVFQGVVVSPKIASLHAAGAIRGLGVLGEELARTHTLAENVAKGELILVVAMLVLNVEAIARSGAPS
jgi:uncharacterized membrane protein